MVGMVMVSLVELIHEQHQSQGVGLGLWSIPWLANALLMWGNASVWPTYFFVIWGVLTGIMLIWLWRAVFARRQRGSGKRAMANNPDSRRWGSSVQWLYDNLETDVLTNGFSYLTRHLLKAADWLLEHIEGGFGRVWSELVKGLSRASQATLATLEEKPAAKAEGLVEDAIERLARHEQNVLKTVLRWDLALIPLFLAVIVVLLFIV